MKWAPSEFWAATPKEFFAALARYEAQGKEREARRGS